MKVGWGAAETKRQTEREREREGGGGGGGGRCDTARGSSLVKEIFDRGFIK